MGVAKGTIDGVLLGKMVGREEGTIEIEKLGTTAGYKDLGFVGPKDGADCGRQIPPVQIPDGTLLQREPSARTV